MQENPFPGMKITDLSFLDLTDTRYICKHCDKSRKFYCYSCCTPNPYLNAWLPKVKLPVKIDIIKHQNESDGKSTCPHAAVLAPDDVTVYTFPCVPNYDKDKTVLVFPCKEAVTLKELAMQQNCDVSMSRPCEGALGTVNTAFSACVPVPFQNMTLQGKRQAHAMDQEDCGPQQKRMRVSGLFERAVFIDSTWNQTSNIIQDERLKELRRVELRNHETQFWRCQKGLDISCLSTIEAVYYFMREYHDDILGLAYSSEYDNLLLFFLYLYRAIRERKDRGKYLKAYQRQRKDQ